MSTTNQSQVAVTGWQDKERSAACLDQARKSLTHDVQEVAGNPVPCEGACQGVVERAVVV
jgi:hypothetical protein